MRYLSEGMPSLGDVAKVTASLAEAVEDRRLRGDWSSPRMTKMHRRRPWAGVALIAMQKVDGSSPFIRLIDAPRLGGEN